MKKIIVFSITIFQIIFIVMLIFRIYYKKEFGNKEISINQISTETSIYSPSGGLKYFYEPEPNSDDPLVSRWSSLFNAKYTINKDSLNERFDYSIQKPEGVFRIITLGDSLTYGLYVDTKDNWAELLENKLNALKCEKVKRINVINLGVYGYDNQYVTERYKKRGIKYNPDLVIWLETDMLRMNEKVTSLFLKKKSEDATSEAAMDDGRDNPTSQISLSNETIGKLEAPEFYEFQKVAATPANIKKGGNKLAWSSVNEEIIDELGISESVKYEKEMLKAEQLKSKTEKTNYNLVWSTIREEVIAQLKISEIYKFQIRAIKKLDDYFTGDFVLISMSVVIKDEEKTLLKDLMVKRKNGYFFDGLRDIYKLKGVIPNEGHPNQKGHRMIAEDIFNYLQTSKLIPCD